MQRRVIDSGTSRTRTGPAADFDLEALTLSELKNLQKDVAEAISIFEVRQKAEARAKVEAFARDLGYSLAELVGTDTKASRAPAATKYRHPENPALTWSGWGRKPNHPWTNGQVERMNRTIKDATVKRYHYDSREQLHGHLADFLDAYNYARRLKTLNGLTPYEYICKIWTSEPDRFIVDPIHQMPGPNT